MPDPFSHTQEATIWRHANYVARLVLKKGPDRSRSTVSRNFQHV
jgi:hypothetical protein